MSDEELAAHLAEHEMRAIGYYETEIAQEQADNLDRYYRRPYGNEREGRSKVVDGTVAITVDNAQAAILRPFTSSDETVMFEPEGKEDEEQAEQATEYVNYVLHQDNNGFQILYDWTKDALIQKLGVVKAYWEDYSRETVEWIESLDPMQVEALSKEGAIADGPYGPDEAGLFAAGVVRKDDNGKLCVENVPPEEYRISPFSRPGRTPPYEAHITNKARSELIEMGFDHDVIMGLSKASGASEDSRHQSRYQDEAGQSSSLQPPGDESRQLVQVNDEYALIDYDGDGISELRHVIRCDTTILLNEEAEYSPFARFCPSPMPHKIYGMCPADQVKHEQEIATALWRQTLDNLYLSNNPRPVLGEGAERSDGSTVDDILSDAPGAVIRAKDASQLGDFSVPFVADKSYPMLEYVSNQAEARSGISKQGQGLNPEALDTAGQVSATQAAIMEDGRNVRPEMMARVFAETGLKQLFKIMLKLLVAHQPRSRMIRLRNKWVEMDPRSWNANMDMTIAVGLGVGNKASQMASAQGVLELMERVGPTPFGSLIDKQKVYNACKRYLNATGIKNTDDFLVEPERDQEGNVVPEEPQPNPEMMKVQAEMQMQQAKMAGEQQLAAAKLEFQREEAALKIQLSREEAAAELELAQAKAVAEMQLAREKMAFEQEAEMERIRHEDVRSSREMDRRDRETDGKLSKNREGGDLDK